jgi:hypothetical protein
MTRQQRLLGMAVSIAMMVSGIVLLGASVGIILSAFPNPSPDGAIAVGATEPPPATIPQEATNEAIPTPSTPTPLVTATFTDVTLNPTATPVPPTATIAPVQPTETALAPASTSTVTPLAPSTATTPPIPATSTPLSPTPPVTVTLAPTLTPPPQLTLVTTPITSDPEALTTTRCASLDGQIEAGLYQVESPAQIGVEQRLCLGGYPMGETVTVYLTGRSAMAVPLTDDDGNGFGYAEVRYVPTRNDRNRPLNMTASSESVTASGQITIDTIIPGVGLAPAMGTSFDTFYTVLTFPDEASRDLFLYRRVEGDTFAYVRQVLLLPQLDSCVPFNPCYASDLSLSREVAGEYRFVEYSPTGGFRLFPGDLAPLGFVVANPDPTVTPGITPEIPPSVTPSANDTTATPEATITATLPAGTETPTAIPTLTVEPTATVEATPTVEPTPTPTPPPFPSETPTPVITAQEG